MTTIDRTEIKFNRDTKDFDILDSGEYIASAANYHDAEQKRTAYLASRAADGIIYLWAAIPEGTDENDFSDVGPDGRVA